MKQYILWLVALIVLVGVAFALTSGAPKGIGMPQNPILQTSEITETGSNYDIVAKYPTFGVTAFDARIKQAVDEAIMEIKNAPAPDPATYKNALDIRFMQPYIGPDFLSVKLAITQYTGGAHPMTIVSGLNYDRKTGKILMLSDVLPMIGLTVSQVSEQATAQLTQKLEGSIFPEGVNTNPENFSSFTVSADKVTFIFQPYQVAAYAAGPQEVSFPRVQR